MQPNRLAALTVHVEEAVAEMIAITNSRMELWATAREKARVLDAQSRKLVENVLLIEEIPGIIEGEKIQALQQVRNWLEVLRADGSIDDRNENLRQSSLALEYEWYTVLVGREPGVFRGVHTIATNVQHIPGAWVEQYPSRELAEQAYHAALKLGKVAQVTLLSEL